METLQRTANRGSISTGAYEIDNSCKFEDANDEYLTRTNASGTNQRTWTVSFWCKRTKLSTADGLVMELWDGGVYSEATRIGFGLSSDELWYDIGYSSRYRGQSTRQFTDTNAWYHIVWKVDTTQSTEADRSRIYVNGEELTSWSSRQYPTQNFDTSVASGLLARIGSYDATYHGFHGYIAEFNYLDGLAVAPTEFGEFDDDTGIWIPKEYTGSYPGQSAYLDFKDGANLGANAKGDDTDWTEVNLAAADQATDTPTNNFCTFNPTFSWIYSSTDSASTILNGATTADNVSGTSWKGAVGTIAVNKGKWYWEWENNAGAFGHRTHGILTTEYAVRSTYQSDDYSNQIYFRDGATPTIRNLIDGTASTLHNMTAYTSDNADVFGIALNMDDQEATFYRNGSAITIDGTSNTTIDISSVDGDTKYVYPLYSCYGSTEAHYNFGGFTAMGISSGASDANGYGTFEYAPPSGYYALCTKNLAEYG